MPSKEHYLTPYHVELWLAEQDEVYGHKIEPTDLINSAKIIEAFLVKANKRVNVIALYFAWKGVQEHSVFFPLSSDEGMDHQELSKFNYEKTIQSYLDVPQAINDVNLFIKTCAYLNLSFKSQGRNVSVLSAEDAENTVSVIKIDSIEWSAEIVKKLSKASEIKTTEFNSIVMSFKHLVLKYQMLLLLPKLDDLLNTEMQTYGSISKELKIKPYNLQKLIEIGITMGRYTQHEIDHYFANVDLINENKARFDEDRYVLSKTNSEFITRLADEHYRGNKYLALSKVVSTMRHLTESELVEEKKTEDGVEFVRNPNAHLLSSLANSSNYEDDDE